MLTYDDLVEWAGAEHVTRADPDAVAGWKIPEDQKQHLVHVGVPMAYALIEAAAFQRESDPQLLTQDEKRLYRLTENRNADLEPGLIWSFGVEPETGTVYFVQPDGEACFANSSIDLWLQCLHHYGRHLSQSEVLDDPEDRDDEAVAELDQIAHRLKEVDPPAFGGYNGALWAEFLDRWLW